MNHSHSHQSTQTDHREADAAHHHAEHHHDHHASGGHGNHGGHGGHGGHSGHGHHSPAMFKQRFFISLILTLPILYFSPQLQGWLGYEAIDFPGVGWINPILGIALYFYGGWPFLQGAWHEFQSKIGMMTLIALAITVAFIYSLAVLLGLEGMPFYWELATLIDIMLLGHWIEMASVQGASKALEELSTLVPNEAHRMQNGEIEDVSVDQIQTGDVILIRPGEQIPNDGEVIEGNTSVNHALGLAIPLVIANSTGLAARNGILVRNRDSLERAKDVKIVAFDKTGTLTQGKFGVQHIAAEGMDEGRALAIAAALENPSEHPLAKAIVDSAKERQLDLPRMKDFQTVTGRGVEGSIDGQTYRVGRPEWVKEENLSFPDALKAALDRADNRGESAVVLMTRDRAIAVISMADQVRELARTTIDRLHEMDIQAVMITGDAEAVARSVAQDLGIDRYYARVLPEDKVNRIKELKKEASTAFVGDGINDAAALLEANMGLAIGAGTNVAIESADLVLVEDDPLDAVKALVLAKKTYGKMIQNLFWATGYNIIAIPLAAGVLSAWGIVLSPAVGALLMSLSTVIVAINAVMRRRAKLA